MISIRNLTLFALAILAALTVANFNLRRTSADDQSSASKQESVTKLIGTWKLEKAKNPGSPSGIGTRLKMFTGTHWCVLQPDEEGKIIFLHGGTYEFNGSDIKTETHFAGELTESFIGNSGTAKLEIEGDMLKQIDPNGVFDETWRRVKKAGGN